MSTETNNTKRRIFCEACQRELVGKPVMLELDQRINRYHDFGGVPEEESQGWFEFGADCARRLRKAAAEKLAKIGLR